MAEPATETTQEQETNQPDIEGLVRNRDQILEEKRQLKAQFEELQNKFKSAQEAPKEIFGKPIDQVEKILKHFESNEEAQKIAEGKWDEVIQERTENMRKDFEKKQQSYEQELETLRNQFTQTAQERDQIYVETQVRNALGDKVFDTAVPDAIRRAMDIFKRDEDGGLVARKGDEYVYGKDGRTPLTPQEWVESVLPEEAPHYFKAMSGGGERGSPSGGKGNIMVTRQEMEDPRRWAEVMEEADKRGVDVQFKD